jgi:hypothetical protein
MNTPSSDHHQLHLGSCLCGAARYSVAGDFDRFYLCHCTYCRKDTGSAHAANLVSFSAKLQWLSAQDTVTHFNLPSTRHGRSFCSICGSALPSLQMDGKMLLVPAGSLDGDVPIRPTAHLFVGSKANWDRALDQVPMLDQFPSE